MFRDQAYAFSDMVHRYEFLGCFQMKRAKEVAPYLMRLSFFDSRRVLGGCEGGCGVVRGNCRGGAVGLN